MLESVPTIPAAINSGQVSGPSQGIFMCIFLDCGKKLKYLKETNTWTNTLYIKMAQGRHTGTMFALRFRAVYDRKSFRAALELLESEEPLDKIKRSFSVAETGF